MNKKLFPSLLALSLLLAVVACASMPALVSLEASHSNPREVTIYKAPT